MSTPTMPPDSRQFPPTHAGKNPETPQNIGNRSSKQLRRRWGSTEVRPWEIGEGGLYWSASCVFGRLVTYAVLIERTVLGCVLDRLIR